VGGSQAYRSEIIAEALNTNTCDVITDLLPFTRCVGSQKQPSCLSTSQFNFNQPNMTTRRIEGAEMGVEGLRPIDQKSQPKL